MIEKELPERESKTLEYKRELPTNLAGIIKTCVAFSNTAGGRIVLGVEDERRTVIGLTEVAMEKAFECLSPAVYEAVTPAVVPEVFHQTIDGKHVIVIDVSRGSSPPYFVKRLGSTKGVFVRVGPTTRLASPEHIQELMSFRSRASFDEESLQCTIDELDVGLIEQAYGRSPSRELLLSEKVLLKSGGRHPAVSAAAMLAFGKRPDKEIPEATVICTRFRGESGRDIVESDEIRGPVSDLTSRVLEFLRRHLERNLNLRGAHLRGMELIPLVALREAVVNALIHRKYNVPSPVKVAVFDNRVEIFSPGGLPGLITLKQLGDGSSHLRNPLLAKFARRLRIIEKLGSGVRVMFEECQKRNIVPPAFFEDGDYVKVVFGTERSQENAKELSTVIANLFLKQSIVRVSEISQCVKVSRNTITNALNRLIEEGKIARHGHGAGTYYTQT
jgi:ATP-dependent DNA helicase RecG